MVHTAARTGLSALITVAAAAAACASMWWIAVAAGGGYGTAVLATVVALTLSRRTFASRTEFARSSLALPAIGLVAAGVGWLLVAVPPVGAVLFVLGMSVPIWLRRFGDRAGRLGALLTLPFTAILVAPGAVVHTGRWWLDLLLVVGASVVAIVWVGIAREVGAAAGLVVAAEPAAGRAGRVVGAAKPAGARPAGATRAVARSRLPASTRMALQLAVALSAAFVAGWLLFPDHVMWTVLTAFIVCSGNRGRGDVVYKSVLRVAGALAGTVAAVALSFVVEPTGLPAVVIIFAALFVGTWLRAYSYAFWALAVTLVLSLLQGVLGAAPTGASVEALLAERVLAIVTGAVLGIAASWFVLPVRSGDIVRRRLGDTLIALGEVFAQPAASRAEQMAAFRTSIARLEQLAPTHRAHRMVARRGGVRPIDCIEAALALPAAVDARLAASVDEPADPAAGARLRDALVAARRSLAAPADFGRVRSALLALTAELRG